MTNPVDITCETQGHLWGPRGVCVMCHEVKPAEQAPSKDVTYLEWRLRPDPYHDQPQPWALYLVAAGKDAWHLLNAPAPLEIRGAAHEPRELQRYSIHGVLTPISENGVAQIGLTEVRHAAVHDVYLQSDVDRASQPPPVGEVAILRNCLGNLYVAVQNLGRVPGVPRDADVQFAMREAAQALGPPYSTATKGESHG